MDAPRPPPPTFTITDGYILLLGLAGVIDVLIAAGATDGEVIVGNCAASFLISFVIWRVRGTGRKDAS
jgi:hypothetical protein